MSWRNQPPTVKQLRYLATLAYHRGTTYTKPQTAGEASDQITQLKKIRKHKDRTLRTPQQHHDHKDTTQHITT